MTFTNKEIYQYAMALNNAFADNTQSLPVKINFYLMKNKNEMVNRGMEIEEARMAIIQKYGVLVPDGSQYSIPTEMIAIAQHDLDELFNITQDVNIYKVKIDDFRDDDMLTMEQMEAMMFMVE